MYDYFKNNNADANVTAAGIIEPVNTLDVHEGSQSIEDLIYAVWATISKY